MAYRFSRRSSKYVWLSVPGLFSMALAMGWVVSASGPTQRASRQEIEWRQQRQAAKDRQDFLAENQLYSDYNQVILEGVAKDDPELRSVMSQRLTGESFRGYAAGQVVRMLDQHHQFVGYLRDGQAYLEVDNPGLSQVDQPDIATTLNQSRPL